MLKAIHRFTELCSLNVVEHGNSSLMGVIRTVEKYGNVAEDKAKVNNSNSNSNNDSNEQPPLNLNNWTGAPLPGEEVLFCRTVSGSYKSMKDWKCKVKLSPGTMKRGKVGKQCVSLFLNSVKEGAEKDCILALDHNNVSMSCIGDAKVDGKEGKVIEKMEKDDKKKKAKEKAKKQQQKK